MTLGILGSRGIIFVQVLFPVQIKLKKDQLCNERCAKALGENTMLLGSAECCGNCFVCVPFA